MEPMTILLGGIVIVVLIVLLALILAKLAVPSQTEPVESNLNVCMKVSLLIDKANSQTDTITVQRLAGVSDVEVVGIKALVGGKLAEITSPEDQGLEQLETKTYKLNYDLQPREEVRVAAVIGRNGHICTPVASAKAD